MPEFISGDKLFYRARAAAREASNFSFKRAYRQILQARPRFYTLGQLMPIGGLGISSLTDRSVNPSHEILLAGFSLGLVQRSLILAGRLKLVLATLTGWPHMQVSQRIYTTKRPTGHLAEDRPMVTITYTVVAYHPLPDWDASLTPLTVKVSECNDGKGGTVFYATCPKLGCGKDRATAVEAIYYLLGCQGYRNVRGIEVVN